MTRVYELRVYCFGVNISQGFLFPARDEFEYQAFKNLFCQNEVLHSGTQSRTSVFVNRSKGRRLPISFYRLADVTD